MFPFPSPPLALARGAGVGNVFEGFIKGLRYSNGPRGQVVGEDATLDAGRDGIRVGDGYHDGASLRLAPRTGCAKWCAPVTGTGAMTVGCSL
jgi:hypothetical protein